MTPLPIIRRALGLAHPLDGGVRDARPPRGREPPVVAAPQPREEAHVLDAVVPDPGGEGPLVEDLVGPAPLRREEPLAPLLAGLPGGLLRGAQPRVALQALGQAVDEPAPRGPRRQLQQLQVDYVAQSYAVVAAPHT